MESSLVASIDYHLRCSTQWDIVVPACVRQCQFAHHALDLQMAETPHREMLIPLLTACRIHSSCPNWVWSRANQLHPSQMTMRLEPQLCPATLWQYLPRLFLPPR